MCALWLAGSLWFQGGGFIDIEAQHFVQHYLAERDFLPTIFDVRRNDWNWYQARELSYLVDWIDAHALEASLRAGVAHLYPISHHAIVLVIVLLHLRWGRRYFPALPPALVVLLAGLFLTSSHSFLGLYFRSAKDGVALALYALVGLTFLGPGVRDASGIRWGRLSGGLALAIAMAHFDRQGIFYLGALAGVAALLLVIERDARHGVLLGVFGAALALSELNNRVITPAVIAATNGYRPTLVHQSLGFVGEELASQADGAGSSLLLLSAKIVLDVVGAFFGSFGALGGVIALAAMGLAFRGAGDGGAGEPIARRIHRHRHLLVFGATLPLLWALSWLMGLKRDFMLWPESRLVYYWTPLNALLLFAATAAAARLLARRPGLGNGLALGLAVLVAANVLALPRHRAGYVYPGSSFTGHESAQRLLRCLRRRDVDAPLIGLHPREVGLCRFLLRRVDPRMASDPRDPAADFDLGIRYANGRHVPRDAAEALVWLRRAARVGYAPAQAALGSLRFDEIALPGSHAVPPTRERQLAWLERGARAGDAVAQYQLASAYERGADLPRDPLRALAWAHRAARQGHPDARRLVRRLRDGLTPEQVRAAKELLPPAPDSPAAP